MIVPRMTGKKERDRAGEWEGGVKWKMNFNLVYISCYFNTEVQRQVHPMFNHLHHNLRETGHPPEQPPFVSLYICFQFCNSY